MPIRVRGENLATQQASAYDRDRAGAYDPNHGYPEQTALLSGADGAVLVVDANDRRVGQLGTETGTAFSPERIAAARPRLRSESGGITTAELLARMQKQ